MVAVIERINVRNLGVLFLGHYFKNRNKVTHTANVLDTAIRRIEQVKKKKMNGRKAHFPYPSEFKM